MLSHLAWTLVSKEVMLLILLLYWQGKTLQFRREMLTHLELDPSCLAGGKE